MTTIEHIPCLNIHFSDQQAKKRLIAVTKNVSFSFKVWQDPALMLFQYFLIFQIHSTADHHVEQIDLTDSLAVTTKNLQSQYLQIGYVEYQTHRQICHSLHKVLKKQASPAKNRIEKECLDYLKKHFKKEYESSDHSNYLNYTNIEQLDFRTHRVCFCWYKNPHSTWPVLFFFTELLLSSRVFANLIKNAESDQSENIYTLFGAFLSFCCREMNVYTADISLETIKTTFLYILLESYLQHVGGDVTRCSFQEAMNFCFLPVFMDSFLIKYIDCVDQEPYCRVFGHIDGNIVLDSFFSGKESQNEYIGRANVLLMKYETNNPSFDFFRASEFHLEGKKYTIVAFSSAVYLEERQIYRRNKKDGQFYGCTGRVFKEKDFRKLINEEDKSVYVCFEEAQLIFLS